MTADYERGNFSVSQCRWEANTQSNIVPILKPVIKINNGSSSEDPGNSSDGTGKSASTKSTPIGAIAGGAAGGVAILALATFLLYWFCIKPRRRRHEAEAAAAAASDETQHRATSPPDPTLKPELDSEEIRKAHELGAVKNQWFAEVDGQQRLVFEMDSKKGVWAVEADGTPVEIHEMPAREEVAAELIGSRDSIEVAPSRQRWSWEMTDPAAPPHSLPRDETIMEDSPQVSEASPISHRLS